MLLNTKVCYPTLQYKFYKPCLFHRILFKDILLKRVQLYGYYRLVVLMIVKQIY